MGSTESRPVDLPVLQRPEIEKCMIIPHLYIWSYPLTSAKTEVSLELFLETGKWLLAKQLLTVLATT
jgi:hypothetical protein